MQEKGTPQPQAVSDFGQMAVVKNLAWFCRKEPTQGMSIIALL